jgi:oligoendopeptidase F
VNVGDGVRWDLSGYFPVFNGPEMLAFRLKWMEAANRLMSDGHGLGPVTADNAPEWSKWLLRFEEESARLTHYRSYLECLEAAHADNESYAGEGATVSRLEAVLEKAEGVFVQAIKSAADDDFRMLADQDGLAGVRYYLHRLRAKSRFIMNSGQEMLAADLGIDGIHGWGRLYGMVSGRLTFSMATEDGRIDTLPISRWRSLLSDPDKQVRTRAYEGGSRAWKGVADVCAAAINAIAGSRLTLNRYRGIDGFLAPALFESGIGQPTLEAMYRAIWDHLDLPREIFLAKARSVGQSGIAFFEREAPLPLGASSAYTWENGRRLVEAGFMSTYPALGCFFRTLIDRRWVESEMRSGKRPGAFCTESMVTGEQRIFMSFGGSLNDLATLAHETGHAWHSHLMGELSPLARRYPMTLAETASIFAEQLLAESIQRSPSVPDPDKLAMVDAELTGAAVMLLDITVRFEFEKRFHEERCDGTVSLSRLNALMAETQRRVFGSALVENGEDPLFWASKLHFYISDLTFYNFPYTFGFLMARFLLDRFRTEGADFLPRYEVFLKASGSAPVEDVLSRTFDQDITDTAFWAAAINTLDGPVADFRQRLEAFGDLTE